MEFADIEKLRREFTDKYVVVDERRPELRRFRGLTGQVKTINGNGRALVQFDGNNNIGWYDIELDFLSIVPPPPPKEDKKAARKPAPAAADKAAAPPAEKKESAKPAEAPPPAAPAS